MSEDDIGGLKFIASMFKMVISEIENVMGKESLQTIFRLIGERVGENVANRIQASNPSEFSEKFLGDVLEPVLGAKGAEISVEGDEMSVILKACPFKEAGIDISNMFYCTYTEGLIETAAKESLGNLEFKSEKLRATDNCDCSFKLNLE